MTHTLDKVREFHEAFDLPVRQQPDVTDLQTNLLRINLLAEELDELRDALAKGDVVEVLDALTDLQYVLDGAYLSFGLHAVKHAAFDEVHRSNMSKLGEDGRPIRRPEDGKVMKGPDYFKPELAKFIPAKGNRAA